MVFKNFKCISSGNFSQNSEIFNINTRNKQCVANSVCSIAYSYQFQKKSFLTTDDIDKILIEGDCFYIKCKRDYDFLLAEEIQQTLKFNSGETFKIEQYLITHDTENVVLKIIPKINDTDPAIDIVETSKKDFIQTVYRLFLYMTGFYLQPTISLCLFGNLKIISMCLIHIV